MPKKKQIENDLIKDQTENVDLKEKQNLPLRSLEFFQVVEGFSKSTYYRLQYEIRPYYSKRMTISDWQKLLQKIKKESK